MVPLTIKPLDNGLTKPYRYSSYSLMSNSSLNLNPDSVPWFHLKKNYWKTILIQISASYLLR